MKGINIVWNENAPSEDYRTDFRFEAVKICKGELLAFERES